MTSRSPFAVRCTLTFGDIYGQVLAWMAVIFVSLASGLALMGSSRPLFALVGVGLILVLSLPFLLFAFVTTLLNHIQLNPINNETAEILIIRHRSAIENHRNRDPVSQTAESGE